MFLSTKKGNPCKICGDIKGKCRETDGITLLCMNLSEAIPGYRYVGRSKNDLWGKFIPDNGEEWSETRREEWRLEQERIKRDRLQEEALRKAEALSEVERDREIRKVLAQLELSPEHQADLQRRGLSNEQIKQGMFRSVEKWQKLHSPVSSRLAGVDIFGRSLTNFKSGYICPVWNEGGLITGYQIRLDDTEDGKYRWATSRFRTRPSGPTSNQKNGELPIATCLPASMKSSHTNLSIGFAEGILKPWIAAQLGNMPVIGAAGGLWTSSPQNLRSALEAVEKLTGSKKCLLYPDKGAISNKNVMRQYRALHKILSTWGYELNVAWWGQNQKTGYDIDELLAVGKGHLICELNWETFEAIAADPKGNYFEELLPSTKRLKDFFEEIAGKFSGWGFSKEPGQTVKDPAPTPKIKYQPGERLAFWESAFTNGGKFVVDSSGTGTGKSYDTGSINPEKWGFQRCVYISSEHRNPSTPTLQDWEDLEARHGGLARDTFGKWRRVKPGEPYEVKGNCDRTQLLGVLRSKNVKGADTAELLCPTCPNFEDCREGKNFGFLHQRTETLKSTKIRCHPDSLPGTDTFNYAATKDDGGTLLIWEEWSEILKFCREFTADANDCEQVLMRLNIADASGNQFGFSKFLLELWLAVHNSNPNLELGRYGLDDRKVREWLLPLLPDFDIDTIAAALDDSNRIRGILQGLGEHGLGLEDLDKQTRARFAARDSELADRAEKLLKEWFIPLLKILKGGPGYLHIRQGQLTITTPEHRLREIAIAAQGNIFIDATGNIDKLGKILGIEPDDILQCEQAEIKGAEVHFHQIAELGRMGMTRGKEQQLRSQVLITELLDRNPNSAVIDAKRYSRDGWLRWFAESRGVNDAEKLESLICCGVPCRPINQLAAEFAILTRVSPSSEVETVKRAIDTTNNLPVGIEPYFEARESADQNFRDYVRRDTLATIWQGFGRLRANRRSGETLNIWFLGDFALDCPVELHRAVDIAPGAATCGQQIQMAIMKFFSNAGTGQKITLTKLAEYCKICKQRLSQLVRELGWSNWEKFKSCLVSLVDPNSKTRQKFEGKFLALGYEELNILMQGWLAEIGGSQQVAWGRLLGYHLDALSLSRRKLRVRAPSVPFIINITLGV